jgi:hypothetical protein
MLLELAVKASQALHFEDDITNISPDSGVIGSANVAKLHGIIAFFFWAVSAGLVIWLAVGILGFSAARKHNPSATEAAKKNLTYSIVALVLFGGLSTIVKITTGLLG